MRRLSYAGCVALMAQAIAVQSMGDPRWATIVNQACDYRSRGKGRGAPARRYGNRSANPPAYQGRQERMRRLVGGFRGDKAAMVAKLSPVLRRAA